MFKNMLIFAHTNKHIHMLDILLDFSRINFIDIYLHVITKQIICTALSLNHTSHHLCAELLIERTLNVMLFYVVYD